MDDWLQSGQKSDLMMTTSDVVVVCQLLQMTAQTETETKSKTVISKDIF